MSEAPSLLTSEQTDPLTGEPAGERYSISTQTAFGNDTGRIWGALNTVAPVDRPLSQIESVGPSLSREYLQIGRLMYFEMSDIEIVRGSAEVRRRFLDFIAGQRDAGYRKALRDYEVALRSRNAGGAAAGAAPR